MSILICLFACTNNSYIFVRIADSNEIFDLKLSNGLGLDDCENIGKHTLNDLFSLIK